MGIFPKTSTTPKEEPTWEAKLGVATGEQVAIGTNEIPKEAMRITDTGVPTIVVTGKEEAVIEIGRGVRTFFRNQLYSFRNWSNRYGHEDDRNENTGRYPSRNYEHNNNNNNGRGGYDLQSNRDDNANSFGFTRNSNPKIVRKL